MKPVTSSPLKLRANREIVGKRFRYHALESVGEGGSGVVYTAECLTTKTKVAIKFFLPLYQQRTLPFREETAIFVSELQRMHEKEMECLRHIEHPNIVHLLDHGTLVPKENELANWVGAIAGLPFFAMEFVPGRNLKEFLEEKPLHRPEELVSILGTICDTLTYLHEKKEYLHGDIRPSNILIRSDADVPILIDFALYKNFNFDEVSASEVTKLIGDQEFLPPALHFNGPVRQFRQTEGTRQDLKNQCFPALDLFQFGKTLTELNPQSAKILAPSDYEFLLLLEDELLAWNRVRELTARDLKARIGRLNRSFSTFMGVEELTPPSGAPRRIQLPRRVVATSQFIDNVLNTRSFKRLHAINQLLLVDLLYPGASYKRDLHSLRAYGYAADFLESLAQSPQFRLFASPELVRQALAIALLHDINHFPLLHVFQEAGETYKIDFSDTAPKKANLAEADAQGHTIPDLLDFFCDGKATEDSPSVYELLADIGVTPTFFKDLFHKTPYQLAEAGYPPGVQVVKSLIDSGADVDKLAYLEDDSAFTGVAYGSGIDTARIIATLGLGNIANNVWHITFREEGLPAIESLVMARYWMFRTVYWHRSNRALVSMLRHVLNKVYVLGGGNARDFISDTMWRGEDFVLEYLDRQYRSIYQRESLVSDLLRQPRKIYERLFSVQGASADQRERALYTTIRNLTPSGLEEFRKEVANQLSDFIRVTYKAQDRIREEEVLIDIPGRRLDDMGEIYIRLDSSMVTEIKAMDGPIGPVATQFEKLAKRLRIFVAPRILTLVSPHQLSEKRIEIVALLERCVPKGHQIFFVR